MKKLAFAVLGAGLVVATASGAQTVLNQNAVAQNNVVNAQAVQPPVRTVKAALNAKDDTKVKLTGTIVKYLDDETYVFRDSTGTINVEIDDDLWNGKPIHSTTKITLIGEVDVNHKPNRTVEIDVDSIQF